MNSTATPAADPAAALELNAAALRALASRDFATAAQLLMKALALDNQNPVIFLNLAAALRGNGDMASALKVLDRALALDPRSFLGLLMKGSLLDAHGHFKEAAHIYGQALTQAPPMDRLDAATQQGVRRAQEVNRQYVLTLREQVQADFADSGAVATGAELDRAVLLLDNFLGIRPIYRQEPTHYFYPGMPSIEFYDRSEFPWLADLEAKTPIIQRELQQVMGGVQGFQPYIDYPPGTPVDQWAELNHSPRWKAFHFYYQGRRFDDNCARCPETTAILESLGQPQVANHMPAAMFSVLEPKTRIPPHTGVANVRLVVHLPLIVPPGCGFRVGNQKREWEIGTAMVFDDTIQHEAWNDSDEPRVVMIFDIWSPRLTATDRALIGKVMESLGRLTAIDSAAMGL